MNIINSIPILNNTMFLLQLFILNLNIFRHPNIRYVTLLYIYYLYFVIYSFNVLQVFDLNFFSDPTSKQNLCMVTLELPPKFR